MLRRIMKEETIGIVGLGYVGLPLAAAFAGRFKVVGYDRSTARIEELRSGVDHTGEVESEVLARGGITFTDRADTRLSSEKLSSKCRLQAVSETGADIHTQFKFQPAAPLASATPG